MKKIVRQQNYLRSLIESQNNPLVSFQSIQTLIKSAVEPLLETPEEGVVLHRLCDKHGLQGLLQRLEFSDIATIDYSDSSDNLKEKVWAGTEFFIVMTHRFVAIILWDENSNDKNFVKYYSLYNSCLQREVLDIIERNSKPDISELNEKFKPDRRDNRLLNVSFRKIIENLENVTNDAVLGYAEQNADILGGKDAANKKTRTVIHEIKNQLSICDLYVEIIRRYSEKPSVQKKNIQTSLKTIDKALKLIGNLLNSLKSDDTVNLENICVKKIVDNAIELSKVYLEDKNIDLRADINDNFGIMADFDKLTAVIINLIKNAGEAFELEEDNHTKNDKYIEIKTEKKEDCTLIKISNNAPKIDKPDKIFDYEFTTKTNGDGLGLWICKKSIEAQSGYLKLTTSNEDYTEFVIGMRSVN